MIKAEASRNTVLLLCVGCVWGEGMCVGDDWMHEQDVGVAGGTADIETGQLLVIKRCLCHITFWNHKCLNISFSTMVLFLYIHII